MKILKGSGDFFALDIGTNAVRVVKLTPNGSSWTLEKHAYVPVDSKITSSDSTQNQRRLGEVIMTAIGQAGIKTRDVVIGLPSNKTFTTVVDVPNGSEKELRATMKYQADQYIPMSVDEAKVDWALLGQSLRNSGQQEVLLTSVSNAYSENRLEFVESLGLNVIAAEPDPIAMIRALVPTGNTDALLLLDMGESSTDIAVVNQEAPRLIRTIPVGISSFVKAAVQNLNVQEDQARQFILKFGLAPDRLDGQVLHALEATLDNFSSEVVKSVKFFQTRYESVTINGAMVAGFAAAVPKLDEYLAGKSGIPTRVGDPWQGIQMSDAARQQLAPVGHEFATAVGLAKRSR